MTRQTSLNFPSTLPILIEKHLKRIKKSETGNPADEEWAEVTTLSEKTHEDEQTRSASLGAKLPQQIMEDIPDRSVIIQRKKTDNIEKYENDLIVISPHGESGIEDFLFGSVTEKVVRRAACPVFTVKAFGKSLF